jgi:hypothetical protein
MTFNTIIHSPVIVRLGRLIAFRDKLFLGEPAMPVSRRGGGGADVGRGPSFTGRFFLNGAGKLVPVGAGADEGKGGDACVALVPQLSPTVFRLCPKKPPCVRPLGRPRPGTRPDAFLDQPQKPPCESRFIAPTADLSALSPCSTIPKKEATKWSLEM